MVTVADVFDALTHPRRYRPAWPLEKVLADIRRESGRHFDPAIVAALIESRCYESMLIPEAPDSWEIAIAASTASAARR